MIGSRARTIGIAALLLAVPALAACNTSRRGKEIAEGSIQHIKSRCQMDSDCLQRFALNIGSTASSVQQARPSDTQAVKICEAGYGKLRLRGFSECVNFIVNRGQY